MSLAINGETRILFGPRRGREPKFAAGPKCPARQVIAAESFSDVRHHELSPLQCLNFNEAARCFCAVSSPAFHSVAPRVQGLHNGAARRHFLHAALFKPAVAKGEAVLQTALHSLSGSSSERLPPPGRRTAFPTEGFLNRKWLIYGVWNNISMCYVCTTHVNGCIYASSP